MPDRKTRILHVIPGLSCGGGIPSWLLAVLRHIDRERFHFDFLPKFYDDCPRSESIEDELTSLGSRVYQCVGMQKRFPRGEAIGSALGNSYDVFENHNDWGASILLAAKRAGIPARIAHTHNDVTRSLTLGPLKRRFFRRVQVFLAKRYATHGLAGTELAGSSYFGPSWRRDPRWRILPVGVDLSRFQHVPDRSAVRKSLGIPPDAFIVGHVGRFEEQKNHSFLVDVLSEMVARNTKVRLLCIGEGDLRGAVTRRLEEARLMPFVILTGRRRDVPDLMMGAMDVFVLPSLHEGFGLVLVEAQAAGLPCVFSDVIPKEVDVVPGMTHRMSLDPGPRVWADKLLEFQSGGPARLSRTDALRYARACPFGIEQSARALAQFYDEISIRRCRANVPSRDS